LYFQKKGDLASCYENSYLPGRSLYDGKLNRSTDSFKIISFGDPYKDKRNPDATLRIEINEYEANDPDEVKRFDKDYDENKDINNTLDNEYSGDWLAPALIIYSKKH